MKININQISKQIKKPLIPRMVAVFAEMQWKKQRIVYYY